MNFNKVEAASGLALSFTESPMFISPLFSDDSSYPAPNMTYDGVLNVVTPLQQGFWTQPASALRGGFRYLTVVSTGSAPVTISNVTCEISFSPHIENMRDYSGYFYASDPVFHDKNFLTKVCNASHLRPTRFSESSHHDRSGMLVPTLSKPIRYHSTQAAKFPS